MQLPIPRSVSIMLLTVGLLVSTSVSATYTFTDLNLFSRNESYPPILAVNNARQVLMEEHSRTRLLDFTQDNSFDVWDTDIVSFNDVNQLVGSLRDSNSNQQAALWHSTSKGLSAPIILGFPATAHNNSQAVGINNVDQVIGYIFSSDNAAHNAVRWDKEIPTILDSLAVSFNHNGVRDVNDNGVVVGTSIAEDGSQHAVLWNGKEITDLSPDGNFSEASQINNAGLVVGGSYSNDLNEMHATLWNGSTQMDLGALSGYFSFASSINNANEIVGFYETRNSDAITGSTLYDRRAALWNGANAFDLNTLLAPGVQSEGWVLNTATSINDEGWIVGESYNAITDTYSAYLLTPVPLPASAWMFISAIVGFIGFARNRKK
ncbi:MAG: hypothetical protein V4732_00145 [Pseudomonadota bacterium]